MSNPLQRKWMYPEIRVGVTWKDTSHQRHFATVQMTDMTSQNQKIATPNIRQEYICGSSGECQLKKFENGSK